MARDLLLWRSMSARDDVPAEVESARQQWEEGNRRLEEEARRTPPGRMLHVLVEVLTEELRRRVGQTFTLADLARAYASADAWAPDALAERVPPGNSPAWVSVAQDAAFHAYARGATDYEP